MKCSAVVICKNEEAHIAACLESLRQISDDMIIVDSGSTDRTIEIARSCGASVFEVDWMGYGATKNFGNQQAQHEWIISLDADEVLSPTLVKSIQKLVPLENHVYRLDRMSFYENQWIQHSGWYPDRVTRIFNKNIHWNHKKVHETLEVPRHVKTVDIHGRLEHYSYLSKEDHIQRIHKYSLLAAKQLIDENKRISYVKRLLGPGFRWIKTYIINQGYMDGKAGLQIANMDAYMIRRRIQYFDELQDLKA